MTSTRPSSARRFEYVELLPTPPRQEVPCQAAAAFSEWAAVLCAEAEGLGTELAVNRAILALTHRYFDWFQVVSPRHRDASGSRSHKCIAHVYRASYFRLRDLQLRLAPPPLEPPPPPPLPPPPPPPAPTIAGIFVAELDAED